jgi:predicted transcriptional regulator
MHRRAVFAVAKEKQLFGMLVLEDIKAIDRATWNRTIVRDVMRPVTIDHFVETGTAIREAHTLADSNGCGAVAVIDSEGRLVGVISRRSKS